MWYRSLLSLLFFVSALSIGLNAQASLGPVSKGEIRQTLESAEDSQELINKINLQLISSVKTRGVDFVLSPEEEWALELRDASSDLIAAIRNAVDPAERELRLKTSKQEGLYNSFTANFSRSDLDGRKAALTAGQEFVSLYSNDPNVSQIVAYMKRAIPSLERSVQMLERREEQMQRSRERNAYNSGRNSRRTRNAARSNNQNPAANTTPQVNEAPVNQVPQPPQPQGNSNTPRVVVVYPPGIPKKPVDD